MNRIFYFQLLIGNCLDRIYPDWVEIRFLICETQNENRIMKRTTDRPYLLRDKAMLKT